MTARRLFPPWLGFLFSPSPQGAALQDPPYSLFPRVPIPLHGPRLSLARAGSPRPHFLLGAKSGGGKEPDSKAHARPLPSRRGAAGDRHCSLRLRAGALRVWLEGVSCYPRYFVCVC